MKNIVLIFVMLFAVQLSFGQEKNIIKVNPISLAFGNFNASFERAVGEKSSIQVGGNFFFKLLGTNVNGWGVNGAYRFFITHNNKIVPEGFYIGPRVAFNRVTEDVSDASVATVGLGAMLGYQWVFGSGIALDLGAGPSYLLIAAEDEGVNESFNGFVPNIYFSVGYNF